MQLQQSHLFLTTNNGSTPVFFWSSFDLKASFVAFKHGFCDGKVKTESAGLDQVSKIFKVFLSNGKAAARWTA
jgi:hypothetical protein